jgi:hypothetical protein
MQPGKWRAMAKRRNDGDQLERRRSAGATSTACSCPDFASAVVARLFAAALPRFARQGKNQREFRIRQIA